MHIRRAPPIASWRLRLQLGRPLGVGPYDVSLRLVRAGLFACPVLRRSRVAMQSMSLGRRPVASAQPRSYAQHVAGP